MDCIFCKFKTNEITCYKIYEDDIILCFLDNFPDSNGHCLIIPKEHYTDLDDIDPNILSHIMKTSKSIKKLLEEKLNCDGVILIQNNGIIQEVKHYHLHLKPYYEQKQDLIGLEEIYKKIKEL